MKFHRNLKKIGNKLLLSDDHEDEDDAIYNKINALKQNLLGEELADSQLTFNDREDTQEANRGYTKTRGRPSD